MEGWTDTEMPGRDARPPARPKSRCQGKRFGRMFMVRPQTVGSYTTSVGDDNRWCRRGHAKDIEGQQKEDLVQEEDEVKEEEVV